MNIKARLRKIKRRLVGNRNKDVSKVPVKKYNILLLTNRDSDNVGDQVIEASDIALIHAVMKNLGVSEKEYRINSKAAGIISKAYMETEDPKLLEEAEMSISASDLVVFGGAPLFNYLYQLFYKRTAITIRIAQKYNVPVIFSAIGIESYDEDNSKCQYLKETLNLDCVKQITTRDDYDKLVQYKTNPNLVIGKVADPAVHSGSVFKSYIKKEKKNSGRKKIGIFVLRGNGFIDNKVDFSKEQACALWEELAEEITSRGYDYEIITSGNWGDEAVVEYLSSKTSINLKKCVFNVNNPETLIQNMDKYDGVISCRLHPSIISFAMKIPSVGIVWNPKVVGFYNSIGYEDRVVYVDGINAKSVVDKLEDAMDKGVEHDPEFMMSIYNSLFYAIQKNLFEEKMDIAPYTYDELKEKMPVFTKTSEKEKQLKLKRKFKRMYGQYNYVWEEMRRYKSLSGEYKNIIDSLTEELQLLNAADTEEKKSSIYPMKYHSGKAKSNVVFRPEILQMDDLSKEWLKSGALECEKAQTIKNNGQDVFSESFFEYENHTFVGWNIRIKVNDVWYWYIQNGTVIPIEQYNKGNKLIPVKVFKANELIPYIPFSEISVVVAEAVWKADY